MMNLILGLAPKLAPYGSAGVILLLLVIFIFTLKFFWKEYKGLHDKHREETTEKENKTKDQYNNIAKQMFEVINKNTEAMTKQVESTHDLKESMRELKSVIQFSRK